MHKLLSGETAQMDCYDCTHTRCVFFFILLNYYNINSHKIKCYEANRLCFGLTFKSCGSSAQYFCLFCFFKIIFSEELA